ncbi:MAG: FtsB family cell division protein [Roseiflexaceae bacterium]
MRRHRPQRARPAPSGLFASPPFGVGRSGARLIALVLVVLSLWLLVNFVGQVIASAQMDRQIAEQQAEIARREAENQALKGRLAFAESPAYIEQIAREQLGYAREGDTVVLPTLPERTIAPALAALAPLPAPPAEPNWRGWLRAFFAPDTYSTAP